MLECTFKFITKKYERTPGILNTPFCILYGIGTVVLSLIINKITNNFVLLFSLSFISLTILEYITFILLNKIYNLKLWDYSDMKFNINGKVCLSFSIIWGLLGAVYIKYIFPILNNFFNIAKGNMLYFFILLLIEIVIVDFCYSSYILIQNKENYSYES